MVPKVPGLGVLLENTSCVIGVRISYDNMTRFYIGLLFWVVLRGALDGHGIQCIFVLFSFYGYYGLSIPIRRWTGFGGLSPAG